MNTLQSKGFSLIELMIGITLALIASYAVIQIYLAESQSYKTSNSQQLILNTENAIIHLVSPVVRTAGFMGCGSMNTLISTLNTGGVGPISTLNISPVMLMGYNGSGSTFSYTQANSANDSNANDWTPALPSNLAGAVEKGSDVLMVLGATPYSQPMNITTIAPGSTSFTVQSTTGNTLSSGQYGAISDCTKALVFYISSVGGTSISHAAGTGVLQNTSGAFTINFQPGAQFIPLQQTVFFVAQGMGGQSSLMRAILNGSTWTIQPLVPGVEYMRVQYGVGNNGIITQYVTADAVSNWALVYSVRIGFIVAGQPGSGPSASSSFTVLNTQVTTPADGILRHVFVMTINLRNATL